MYDSVHRLDYFDHNIQLLEINWFDMTQKMDDPLRFGRNLLGKGDLLTYINF